ncbi:MAG: SRPBCC family protein [Anaerolineae bacterium]|nr:SRPBCC family protein [Anaerolineae bacterium]
MYFERTISIDRTPADVFAFLRDKDTYPQAPGSPVLLLERTTGAPVGVGTRYREVVRMFPLVQGEIWSEITRYEPPCALEERFWGTGVEGHLAYEFRPEGEGTRLVQRETIRFKGLMAVIEPLIRPMFLARIEARLVGIRDDLESGWQV